MFVKSIELDGFRNYDSARAEFSENVNVITGENAQGKTNLLEAVYYLTCGRSFRSRFDREIIGFGRDRAAVTAQVVSGGREQVLKAELHRGRRKSLYANGVKLKTAAELSGKLTAVLFCPDDLNVIRAGSGERRRLMDHCLSQLRPRYAAALGEYSKLYEHKSRILKDWREKPSLLDALDDFDEQMCAASAVIIYYRAAFAALLSEKASEIHREFSGGREELSIRYTTVKTVPDPAVMKPKEILPYLIEHQAAHRAAEKESGTCLSGAHKDDLEIMINGASAKSYASQGQARTAALSIKLAERGIHYDDRGEYPVLLLDDVLSELDGQRQSFILNSISDGQVLITCCEDMDIARRTGGRVLGVDGGRITCTSR